MLLGPRASIRYTHVRCRRNSRQRCTGESLVCKWAGCCTCIADTSEVADS